MITEVQAVITPDDNDLAAVEDIIESLEISWWLKDKYSSAFALAYARGKQAQSITT